MIDEPTTTPINEGDNDPATKRQMREVKLDVEGIDRRLIRVEQDVGTIKQDVKTLKGDVKTLQVDMTDVKEGQSRIETKIDTILDNTAGLPDRVTKLEQKATFRQ